MSAATFLPQFVQLQSPSATAAQDEACKGLMQPAAAVSPKFLYDALGSRLFDAITELDEYYPTRTEAGIFQAHQTAIAQAVHRHFAERLKGAELAMVDLGAGSCAKAASLFSTLRPARYLALDISADYLRGVVSALQQQHPHIAMMGVGLDFSRQLALPTTLLDGPSLVFYPGSSIGNFSPDQALNLLRQARELCAGGGLLIGVDLVKEADTLQRAYDDPLGVTGAFNLNLLRNLNQLLVADFDLRQWQHVALFNQASSRIEMHLKSRVRQLVSWQGGERWFEAGERIHTENSYKWRMGDFEALLRDAGFGRITTWNDPKGWYAVSLALVQ